MTSPEPQTPEPVDAEEEQPEETPLYFVSFERLATLNRSPIVLISERRMPSCPSLQHPDHELSDPKALVDEIAKYCGEEEEFIRSSMTIQEIVFRTILARRNEPTSLTDLHHELTERWSTPIRPINITEERLQRVLDTDDYYGFARVVNEG
ncbi:MAG: hypothetical protein IH962_01580 [Chloroflexi bacterium]|nr:hypothetical protein [Chloroflexota bacterium]